MAIISTRQADEVESEAIQGLIDLLEDASQGTISNRPTALVQAGTDIDSLLKTVRMVIDTQRQVAQRLFADVVSLAHENMVLSVKYAEAMIVLDSIMDISYDDALDHATADLMDALVSAGVAEADHHGDLVFDARVPMGRSDLKPVLREAIVRWVGQKVA